MAFFKFVPRLLLPVTAILLITCLSPAKAVDQRKRYKFHNLPKLLRSSGKAKEFLPFTGFDDNYNQSAHLASVEYLDSHPQLVQRIRDDLNSEEIRWQLEELTHRLLYAPENREEVAGLFTTYCLETIDDMLELTGLDNPYTSISTRMEVDSVVAADQGIRAVIVQDLAREYIARYQFSGTDKKRIKIGLSGRITINEVGSYSSYLHYSEETGDWEFSRNRKTVWKSVSANPYTVLMTPLEETLHIALRQHTEKAIVRIVDDLSDDPTMKEVQNVVDDWLAVEEAIVGGLVYNIIPEVVVKRIPDLPQEWIEDDLTTKDGFKKYRHLRKAIKLVNNLGVKESIDFYSRDPDGFRELLIRHS